VISCHVTHLKVSLCCDSGMCVLSVCLSVCDSGMRWTRRSRRATMRWLVKRRNYTCNCTQAGALVTTTDFTPRRNANYVVNTRCCVNLSSIQHGLLYREVQKSSHRPASLIKLSYISQSSVETCSRCGGSLWSIYFWFCWWKDFDNQFCIWLSYVQQSYSGIFWLQWRVFLDTP